MRTTPTHATAGPSDAASGRNELRPYELEPDRGSRFRRGGIHDARTSRTMRTTPTQATAGPSDAAHGRNALRPYEPTRCVAW